MRSRKPTFIEHLDELGFIHPYGTVILSTLSKVGAVPFKASTHTEARDRASLLE